MKIDNEVETLVRETLTGVVKSDSDRFQRALAAFPDDKSTAKAVQLATAVALFVLNDVYGRTPTEAEMRAVADKLVDMENWAGVTSDEVTTFLIAAHHHTRADQVLPLERVIVLSFVLAGNLLSSCCKEGEFWFNYLDRVEATLEAAPGS